MKKLLITICSFALVATTASSVLAQCAFNAPTKSKALRSFMVRAYAGCPSITFPAPNTATMAGVPGCAPPFPLSPYSFNAPDPAWERCVINIRSKVEAPCKDGSGIPCSNTTLKVRCMGIVDPDGVTPTNAPGFALNTVARATFNDNSSGDMTVIDFPAQFSFPQAHKGMLKLKSDTTTLLNNLFGPGSALPSCTSLELITVKIADPNGNIFANLGTSTR